MAAQKGKLFLIQVNTTGSTYVDLVSLRSNDLTINGQLVEVTNKGSAGWRKGLEGAGINSMSLSGSGVVENDAAEKKILASIMANTFLTLKVVDELTNEFAGVFSVANFKYAGEFNGEQTWNVSFESADVCTFTEAEEEG